LEGDEALDMKTAKEFGYEQKRFLVDHGRVKRKKAASVAVNSITAEQPLTAVCNFLILSGYSDIQRVHISSPFQVSQRHPQFP
jgi:hypothetical protein